jgi:hypothetical protein
MGEWRYSSSILDLGTKMEVMVIFTHAPATLPLGKEPPVPIGEEVWWAPELVWTLQRREKSYTAENQTCHLSLY